MLRVSYIKDESIEQRPKKKHVPLYKDPVFMAQLKRSFFEDHNRKIQALAKQRP